MLEDVEVQLHWRCWAHLKPGLWKSFQSFKACWATARHGTARHVTARHGKGNGNGNGGQSADRCTALRTSKAHHRDQSQNQNQNPAQRSHPTVVTLTVLHTACAFRLHASPVRVSHHGAAMFKASRSRPVPSKATLRVLYQLAYISSGTAAGIATLCTEERRRQTAVVQKIADNAKRIRQSPRYRRHSTAALAVNDTEYRFQHVGPDEDSSQYAAPEQDSAMAGMLGERSRHCTDHRGAHASDLPSAVQNGYEQLVNKRRGRKRRRNEKSSSEPDHDFAANGAAANYPKANVALRSNVLLRVREDAIAHSNDIVRSYERPLQASRSAQETHHSDKIPAIPQSTFRFASYRKGNICPRPDIVKRDVDDFFMHLTREAAHRSQNRSRKAQAADVLLLAALHHRLFAEVRSLSLWKALNSQLSEKDVRRICETSKALLRSKGTPESWFEFYKHLFNSPAFLECSADIRAAALVEVISAWSTVADKSQMDLVKGFGISNIPTDALEQPLVEICDKMIANGQCKEAAFVLSSISTHSKAIFLETHNMVLSHALENGEIVAGIELLKCKYSAILTADQNLRIAGGDSLYSFQDDPLLLQQCSSIAIECGRKKAYANLRALFFAPSRGAPRDSLLLKLETQARVHLAIASASSRRHAGERFRALRESVDPVSQRQIDEGYLAIRLKRVWEATRNLDQVFNLYEAYPRKFEIFSHADAIVPGTATMVEICTLAKQPDRALSLLRSGSNSQHSDKDALSLAAIILAEKSSWEEVQNILQESSASQSTITDHDINARLNYVIHLYSKQHSAAESWTFVTSMMRLLGFIPDSTTNKTLLRCFVASGKLDLVAKWDTYLQQVGLKFDLDSRLAASLLFAFWRERRPPHVLLMWFCRALCAFDGVSFTAADFKYVIRAAISFDIRELDAQNKRMKFYLAVENLEKVEQFQGAIPRPATEVDYARLEGETTRHGQRFVEKLTRRAQAVMRDVSNADDIHSGDPLPTSLAADKGLHATDTAASALAIRDLHELRRFFAERDEAERDEALPEIANHGVIGDNGKVSSTRYDSSFHTRIAAQQMVVEMSMQRYQKVLDLYASSSSNGLPASPRTLEIAVEARIRLDKGDAAGAEQLLHEARQAGFDVSCAMGSLLIHKMHHSSPACRKDAEALRRKVIDYYRMNDENGWDVGHHVGVTAANTLINNNRAEHGINLLNAIYQSEWTRHRPLNIVAMTVYVKGYAALQHKHGVRWVRGACPRDWKRRSWANV
ncbi:uncharacterized protein MYCFIDRAFT_82950 [Pseudocercospora fijiensis CIRAD86]|uniref:Uncharacterized protein n=1 Tax=Pseudocercospora fijiensis (strain CIRAD86) TaxID=383855 RepID=M3B6C2_PSEFD|nr:uncharacterized protein MYCFIDRAFT_82950 [Pseudocercospora fijiensis CIRAD86]EME84883.1 hypothetical protein MYCFIDRAFT_82950 [Pseudocercospora fijiensis CIRAD86]